MYQFSIENVPLLLSYTLTHSTSETLRIKLSNFEEATLHLDPNTPLTSDITDLSYLPPEHFLNGHHLPFPATTWTFGCILFELVFARRPLLVSSTDYGELERLFGGVSHECVLFLQGCLCPDSGMRMAFQRIKQHPWFSEEIQF